MPQVEPVGDLAHERQRAQRQDAGERVRKSGGHDRCDHRGGGHRHERGAAAVEKRTLTVDCDACPHEKGRSDQTCDLERARSRPRGSVGATQKEHRDDDADEDGVGACIGAVVGARRIAAGVEEHRHGDDRRDAAERGDGQKRPRRAEAPQQHQRGDRPHDVELLLHRERPHVPQRRGDGEGVEVAGLGEDEPPVRHVADGRQRVVAYPTHVRLAGEEQGVEAHAHQHEEKGRQQAPRPAGPEATEADGTGAAPFDEQQGRDQITAQHEEDVDAEETTARPGLSGVERDDRQHRDAADAVESGDVAQTRCLRRHRRGIVILGRAEPAPLPRHQGARDDRDDEHAPADPGHHEAGARRVRTRRARQRADGHVRMLGLDDERLTDPAKLHARVVVALVRPPAHEGPTRDRDAHGEHHRRHREPEEAGGAHRDQHPAQPRPHASSPRRPEKLVTLRPRRLR